MSETPKPAPFGVQEMAQRNADILAKAEAEGRLRREIRQESMYGPFPGGDPRRFTPDPDASTEIERTRHKYECERAQWKALDLPAQCRAMGDGSYWFGLGTSLVDVEFLIVTNEDGTETEFF